VCINAFHGREKSFELGDVVIEIVSKFSNGQLFKARYAQFNCKMENLDEYREGKVGLDIIGSVSGRVEVLHEELSRIGVVGGKVKNRILSVSDGVCWKKEPVLTLQASSFASRTED